MTKPKAKPASFIPRSVGALVISFGDVDQDGTLDLSTEGTGAAALLPHLKVDIDPRVFGKLARDFVDQIASHAKTRK